MIVRMKKASILVQAKDAESAVEALRSLGVLHVEHQQAPKGKDLNSLTEDLALVNEAMTVLSLEEFSVPCSPEKAAMLSSDWKAAAKHLIDLWKRLDQLQEFSRGLVNKMSELEGWGDFDPQAIRALREKNIFISLYQVPEKEMGRFPSETTVKVTSRRKGLVNCAVVSLGKAEIPFKEIELPAMGLRQIKKRLEEDKDVMRSIIDEIHTFSACRAKLRGIKKSLEKALTFQEALRGMGGSGAISYLGGYVPVDTVEKLKEAARTQKWGIRIVDPSEADRVPTLVRNPRWISVISPVFKMIEVIPGYRELDISLWFLVFFSVFFGMLIGDAGYGAVYFCATLWAQKKWGKRLNSNSLFILFYILSACAILWGLLTATIFGQLWLPAAVKPLVPALRNDRNVQELCFFLGALHLSIAHCWRLILKAPSLTALVDLGWISILWGAFFLARTLILGAVFPLWCKWLFLAGMCLVVLFTNPNKNILKGIGGGLGNLLLNLVNNFTDIVSYIRLFAVGLATVAVADSFNAMAMGIGYNSILTGLATSLILLLGHALNIILGPLAILVHGVRLNVLEFCTHLDIKWSGFAYTPLREDVDS